MNRPVIIWFRQDLRLHDHPALAEAATNGAPVVPCYVFDPDSAGAWGPGGASRWWLHHSLAALEQSLAALGSKLVVRRGDTVTELLQLANVSKACAVYWTRGYEPDYVAVEQRLEKELNESGIEARRFGGGLVFEPEQVRTGSGEPYKVFTPFHKACAATGSPGSPLPRPKRLEVASRRLPSLSISDLNLLPSGPDWTGGLWDHWVPGEQGADQSLHRFIDTGLEHYHRRRDRPDIAGTSRLSPHLHFGEISPRQVWHEVAESARGQAVVQPGTDSLLRELVWREFSYHLLWNVPTLPERPFREQFSAFPWRDNRAELHAWQRGETGYPLVDAGMRELWHTGWMHNRVRMVTASFLTKHLLQPWQSGEAWFWDTLVDADLANNAASWQWVAGCGADAAPYFRIFNPVLQGEKFDPGGTYVRRWIPEISDLPDKHVHAPWRAPASVLERAGVRPGGNYPMPMVDHASARRRALAAYDAIRSAKP